MLRRAATAAGLALALVTISGCGGASAAGDLTPPGYGDAFWKHWGDGRAEVAGYDLRYPRYGELRQGTAVAIFVTESFALGPRVKTEDPQRADSYPVLKLNWVQDFPTGVYDYNMMTSTFVALEPVLGRPAGAATKVSFSAQEWCGHVFAQLRFDDSSLRLQSHSYFEGEADRDEELAYPVDGISEDALLTWARGLASPRLEPGASRKVRLLRSLELARLGHRPVTWTGAVLRRSADSHRIRVPAGEFEVEEWTVEVEGAPSRSWSFEVERETPHRIVRFRRSDGARAELLASARMRYWEMNGEGYRTALEQLGLRPRPDRAP